jgi:endonuclease/exonuclease/phosphatase (EEP) superfamily protein YafD
MWLLRIDYIFHSRDWRTHWARIGPWDGVSDHRPVLARLVLSHVTEGQS